MDRNTGIGLLLMLLLVVGYSYFATPSAEEQAEQARIEQARQDSLAQANEVIESQTTEIQRNDVQETFDPVRDSIRQVMLQEERASKFGIFAASGSGNEEIVSLSNGQLQVDVNTKGGLFESAVILDEFRYPQTEQVPVHLWNEEMSEMNLFLNTTSKGIVNTDDLYFTIQSQKETDSGKELRLRLNTNDPESYVEYIYTLANEGYEVKFDLFMQGMDRHLNFSTGNVLDWKAAGNANEKGIEWERQHSSVFFREEGGDRDYLGEAKEKEEEFEEELTWMAFKQNYFSALVINEEGFGKDAFIKSYPPEDEEEISVNMFYEARLPLDMEASSQSTTSLRFYFGPNEIKKLKALEVHDTDRLIDYGWWIFGWVNRNMIRPTFDWLSGFISRGGVVILVLTFLIKLLLFPITWKNFLSSAKMRVLKPEIDALNEKYKDDQMGKQQAQMALYRETGVSPLAGCLPTLLQIPILYAMFRFFPAQFSLRGESFLWADDLGAYDAIFNLPFEIPFYGDHVSGFTLLMATSTFFYTRMNSANMPTQTQPGMPNMKLIMNIFPFMMLFFFNRYAAGLSLYYFVANLMSIGQMLAIKKFFIDEEKIRAKIDANKKKPKKESGFQKRLQDMYKLQQEQQKNQKKGK